MRKRLAIFASGRGSNAKKIIEYFNNHVHISVSFVVTNKKDAGVIKIANAAKVPHLLINRADLYKNGSCLEFLQSQKIDYVILAGFLLLVPVDMINFYNKKIINLHPSLLPKYGGKGMYGMNVHEAVKEAGEKETGISIHFVNPVFDDGEIIFQAKCQISKEDTPEDIAQKIHELEHQYYPKVIEDTIQGTFEI